MSVEQENSLAAEAKDYVEAVISLGDHNHRISVSCWQNFKGLTPEFREAVSLHGMRSSDPIKGNLFYSAINFRLRNTESSDELGRSLEAVVDAFSTLSPTTQKSLIDNLPDTEFKKIKFNAEYEGSGFETAKKALLTVYKRHFEKKYGQQPQAQPAPAA